MKEFILILIILKDQQFALVLDLQVAVDESYFFVSVKSCSFKLITIRNGQYVFKYDSYGQLSVCSSVGHIQTVLLIFVVFLVGAEGSESD